MKSISTINEIRSFLKGELSIAWAQYKNKKQEEQGINTLNASGMYFDALDNAIGSTYKIEAELNEVNDTLFENNKKLIEYIELLKQQY